MANRKKVRDEKYLNKMKQRKEEKRNNSNPLDILSLFSAESLSGFSSEEKNNIAENLNCLIGPNTKVLVMR
jgi:hypothetical protein